MKHKLLSKKRLETNRTKVLLAAQDMRRTAKWCAIETDPTVSAVLV